MLDREKLASDEARRIAQHEEMKSDVRNEVHGEIARNAELRDDDYRQVDHLAGNMKDRALNEVVETEAEIDRARTIARTSQVIDYIFGLVYGIIGLEIVLEMLGARDSSGFKQFLDAIASPLLAPFQGLMPNPTVGRFSFMFSYIIALVIYMLIHLAVNGLLRLFVHKKTVV
jgi:uncharacterized protein YggT (Ycf19 family)